MSEIVIIEMTPFVFEDGNTYYFKIIKRGHSNDYHDLYVYEKVKSTKTTRSFWGKESVDITETFKKLNEKQELIGVKLLTHEIKESIKKILISSKANYQLKDWDGFVGDVPDDVKISLKRDGRLKDILGE